MRRLLLFLFLLILIFGAAVVAFRTWQFGTDRSPKALAPTKPEVDLASLQGALQFPTISHKAAMRDTAAFNAFHRFLAQRFPLTHQQLERERINEHALIFHWQGRAPQEEPVVLMAHQDVVPVSRQAQAKWDTTPFSGALLQGHVYGRGAIDDKGSLLAIFNAVEDHLRKGFQPERSIYLVFGHDEEIGGQEGGKAAASYLEEKIDRAWMVLDEGGLLTEGLIAGIEPPVALVGVAEKGYMSLQLVAEETGGHSAMPPDQNATAALTEALAILKDNPPDLQLNAALQGLVQGLGPHWPIAQRTAFANLWLFEGFLADHYRDKPAASALAKTTQVITMMQAGIKDNVIPQRATAIVNYRLAPGDQPQERLSKVRELIRETGVKVQIYENLAVPPSPVSPHKTRQFDLVAGAIKAHRPATVVSPFLVLAATDARHFTGLSQHVYRYIPLPLQKEDLPRIHGNNERVSPADFAEAVGFYHTLLKNL